MNTPWGKADNVVKLATGVSWVDTPGHGGFMIGLGAAKRLLSPEAQALGEPYGGYLAYEEDCAYAIVYWEHPEWAPSEKALANLHWSLSINYPESYLLKRGIEPLPEPYAQWKGYQEDRRLRAEKSPDLIVCAEGDWSSWVPKGRVGVTTADDKQYTVPAESYEGRRTPNLLSFHSDVVAVAVKGAA